uniref:hypothetical protein n=1 Tax=Chryseobacterium sp. TaxID=1871047 RepID=UPI0025BCBF6E
IKESNNVKQYHLTPGDIILNIDGHTADFFKNNDMLVNYVREKESLSLTLKDGILIHLKKESFF